MGVGGGVGGGMVGTNENPCRPSWCACFVTADNAEMTAHLAV